jgi:hypothetical protein
MNYFDTSALTRQFVDESGSRRVGTLIAAEPQIATSKVAYITQKSTLAHSHGRGRERGL